ncbi:3-galactosyl-N-acetylglucosaminide 4-alpha-L-fucosyltransferase FUT3-like [Diadema setosum]|uniref:3-galactosyl-N-acetylglucosaminide 4-alpha-L-fucosyltransferase FUT3-like n=1 Tax=Diadema setosum TaxID=31175 RepID=UPI003B3BEA3D
MARRNNGFVPILIPLALMSLMVFNGNVLIKAGQDIYLFFNGGRLERKQPDILSPNKNVVIPVMDKLLKRSEVMKGPHRARQPTAIPVSSQNIPQDFSDPVNGITYEQNRVLYKFYRATQDPNFECVIRILKYRKPKAEERFLNHNQYLRSTCEGIPCSVETKYSLQLESFWDADVVVIMPGPFEGFQWNKLLKARPKGQLWALYSKESPVHEPQFAPPPAIFKGNPYNLSMTFRTGSDIDLFYGHFVRGAKQNKQISKKSKLIMWMASRCDPLGWERTLFVKELQKHIPVDIYGKCGTFECPKKSYEQCLQVMQQYKFYLALENSECKEYITEKFWSNAFSTGMVPIAFGAPREDYERTAPPNSFIHLNDFATMQEFLDYINLLDRNDTLYMKYFEWRKLGKTFMGPGFRTALSPPNLCNLTKKLVEISVYPENSWRAKNPDFEKWWTPTCHHQSELLGIKI